MCRSNDRLLSGLISRNYFLIQWMNHSHSIVDCWTGVWSALCFKAFTTWRTIVGPRYHQIKILHCSKVPISSNTINPDTVSFKTGRTQAGAPQLPLPRQAYSTCQESEIAVQFTTLFSTVFSLTRWNPQQQRDRGTTCFSFQSGEISLE